MPIYEYLCNTCRHNFEVWQKMTDETLTVCPACGEHIHRVLYPAGIVFKGSGFYKTDHGHGSVSSANSDAKKNEKTEDTPTESKTESKSGESKAESKPTESKTESKSGGSKSSEVKTVNENKVAANASKG